MLKQLTVFVENKQGTLVDITDTLAGHGINLRALSIAGTGVQTLAGLSGLPLEELNLACTEVSSVAHMI